MHNNEGWHVISRISFDVSDRRADMLAVKIRGAIRTGSRVMRSRIAALGFSGVVYVRS
jgi:hypothetical protein